MLHCFIFANSSEGSEQRLKRLKEKPGEVTRVEEWGK